jgi:hypothetical protein
MKWRIQELAIILETIPSSGMLLTDRSEASGNPPEEGGCSIGFAKQNNPQDEEICPGSR